MKVANRRHMYLTSSLKLYGCEEMAPKFGSSISTIDRTIWVYQTELVSKLDGLQIRTFQFWFVSDWDIPA